MSEITITAVDEALCEGDIVSLAGAGRWPWLVRVAARLARVKLPPRDEFYRIGKPMR